MGMIRCKKYSVPTNQHTHTLLFYISLDSVWDYPGDPVRER